MVKSRTLLILKCGLLLTLIILTNGGLEERLRVLLLEQRLLTFTVFSLIWVVSLTAVLAAAFQPSMVVRLVWAAPLAISGAVAYGYYRVQGSEFFIFDVLNFWVARHEVQRASEFYSDAVWSSLAVFMLGIVAIAMPPVVSLGVARKIRYWSPWLPMVPVLLIAGVVVVRDGKGSQALPKQFAPLSLAAVAAYKVNTGSFVKRHAVSMTPGKPLARAVVVVVDESIRSDFVSLEPGNSVTPELANLREHWIDFSPAVSSGNCSHLSNAMLRFMADRRDLVRSVHTSPTGWQYAKKAGFRTVYIDAQPSFIGVYGKLQNYMSPAEAILIDRFYKIDSTFASYALDDELVRIVLEEMSAGDRVFIYANKNGAHFPYSDGSPEGLLPDETEAVEADADSFAAELQTYAKAVRWSTDRTMSRLIREAAWSDATVIYTSDHGQNFSPGRLTHCTTSPNVDPNEAIVPLMVASGDASLQRRFEAVAARYPGHATHFAIAPTLLELMGYKPSDIAKRYEGSLLRDLSWKPQFVSDDILGLFSIRPTWHVVDPMLQKRYRSLDDFYSAHTGTSLSFCKGSVPCNGTILH
ncbi:sulfatase-like hydrolase/transferase [Mesorhizobium sp. WSM2239]|uniref:Sulfatase-like hydrolase/transferase n=2 Tax=unclassified Mesorhizobium TaxID=325217 RepID=A0AAU8DH78_9HYPH